MPLTPGTKLNQYEVVEAIGAGGMGEVYRARDTKLGRDVAIKVLPEVFAQDQERLDRFEREARLLAQLNHSNIATLHGLEEQDGQKFLVMELVEGETLAERIARGPIPLDEALPLFIQIAEGMEAAHEKEIIHRDLKPANIKIGTDGKPKILDFGLAKAFVGKQDAATDSSQSPTLTKGTALGAIMGTAAYMSPEQASGGHVDERADIWAFGCCLYESLTGKKPFTGEGAPQILASVLKDEPDWRALPGGLAANVSLLLRRSLEKNVRARLQDIGDARIELAETLSPPATLPPHASSHPARTAGSTPWLWAAAAVLIAFAAGVMFRAVPSGPDARAAEPIKLSIVLPEDLALSSTIDTGNFEISRDGSSIVVAAARAQKRQLFIRALSERQFRPIAGTEGVEDSNFFLSPNGEWVGFYRDGRLWKTRFDGGVPVALFEGPPVWHPHWGADGWIYFASGATSGLFRIPASGGEPVVLTELDREKDEIFHGAPVLLPGGRALVFAVSVGSYDNSHLEVLSVPTGERRIVTDSGIQHFYSPSGHLVYGSGATIYAAPFDVDRLEMTGASVPVVSDVGTDPTGRFTQFALSASGTLVYIRAGQGLHHRRLVWKDRGGGEEPLDVGADRYEHVRLSSDGKRALVSVVQGDGAEEQVFMIDLERGVATQLTFDGIRNEFPLFSPTRDRIAFSSNIDGQWNLYVTPVDASSPPARLRPSERIQQPLSWSPDGRFLVYREITEDENFDLWLLPLSPDGGEPLPLATTPYLELDAAFSPDGRWIAYSSAESGRNEIYLKRFLQEEGGEEQKQQVSGDGGWQPAWSRDGRELFFRNDDGTALMVVDVSTGADLELSRPRLLFEETEMPAPHRWGEATYDVAPDGRFLMLAEDRSKVITLDVVLNWFEELERLVPTEN